MKRILSAVNETWRSIRSSILVSLVIVPAGWTALLWLVALILLGPEGLLNLSNSAVPATFITAVIGGLIGTALSRYEEKLGKFFLGAMSGLGGLYLIIMITAFLVW